VLENCAAGVALGQNGEDAHRAAAGVADQNVGGEHALQKRGPVESTARGWAGRVGGGDRACGDDGGAKMMVGRTGTSPTAAPSPAPPTSRFDERTLFEIGRGNLRATDELALKSLDYAAAAAGGAAAAVQASASRDLAAVARRLSGATTTSCSHPRLRGAHDRCEPEFQRLERQRLNSVGERRQETTGAQLGG
jgi:hypothetical protein